MALHKYPYYLQVNNTIKCILNNFQTTFLQPHKLPTVPNSIQHIIQHDIYNKNSWYLTSTLSCITKLICEQYKSHNN